MSEQKRYLEKCPKCNKEDMLVEVEKVFDGEVTVVSKSCFCGYKDGDAY